MRHAEYDAPGLRWGLLPTMISYMLNVLTALVVGSYYWFCSAFRCHAHNIVEFEGCWLFFNLDPVYSDLVILKGLVMSFGSLSTITSSTHSPLWLLILAPCMPSEMFVRNVDDVSSCSCS